MVSHKQFGGGVFRSCTKSAHCVWIQTIKWTASLETCFEKVNSHKKVLKYIWLKTGAAWGAHWTNRFGGHKSRTTLFLPDTLIWDAPRLCHTFHQLKVWVREPRRGDLNYYFFKFWPFGGSAKNHNPCWTHDFWNTAWTPGAFSAPCASDTKHGAFNWGKQEMMFTGAVVQCCLCLGGQVRFLTWCSLRHLAWNYEGIALN